MKYLPFYKKLINKINNVTIKILNNNSKINKKENTLISKLDTGDIWIRDFMPIPTNITNPKYIKFQYNPIYLTQKDDSIKKLGDSTSNRLKSHFSPENQHYSNIILDGGNFISNGIGTAITTNRIITDNEGYAIDEIKVYTKKNLGITNLIILPVEPGDITGHIDGMVRFVFETTVVVGDYPSSYSIGKIFMNKIAQTMLQLGFNVIRVMNDIPKISKNKFPSAVGNYINYLRVGNTIYLPIYKNKESFNKKAIKVYKSFGLEVIPILSDELAEYGGVLNCITWHFY